METLPANYRLKQPAAQGASANTSRDNSNIAVIITDSPPLSQPFNGARPKIMVTPPRDDRKYSQNRSRREAYYENAAFDDDDSLDGYGAREKHKNGLRPAVVRRRSDSSSDDDTLTLYKDPPMKSEQFKPNEEIELTQGAYDGLNDRTITTDYNHKHHKMERSAEEDDYRESEIEGEGGEKELYTESDIDRGLMTDAESDQKQGLDNAGFEKGEKLPTSTNTVRDVFPQIYVGGKAKVSRTESKSSGKSVSSSSSSSSHSSRNSGSQGNWAPPPPDAQNISSPQLLHYSKDYDGHHSTENANDEFTYSNSESGEVGEHEKLGDLDTDSELIFRAGNSAQSRRQKEPRANDYNPNSNFVLRSESDSKIHARKIPPYEEELTEFTSSSLVDINSSHPENLSTHHNNFDQSNASKAITVDMERLSRYRSVENLNDVQFEENGTMSKSDMSNSKVSEDFWLNLENEIQESSTDYVMTNGHMTNHTGSDYDGHQSDEIETINPVFTNDHRDELVNNVGVAADNSLSRDLEGKDKSSRALTNPWQREEENLTNRNGPHEQEKTENSRVEQWPPNPHSSDKGIVYF